MQQYKQRSTRHKGWVEMRWKKVDAESVNDEERAAMA